MKTLKEHIKEQFREYARLKLDYTPEQLQDHVTTIWVTLLEYPYNKLSAELLDDIIQAHVNDRYYR